MAVVFYGEQHHKQQYFDKVLNFWLIRSTYKTTETDLFSISNSHSPCSTLVTKLSLLVQQQKPHKQMIIKLSFIRYVLYKYNCRWKDRVTFKAAKTDFKEDLFYYYLQVIHYI